MAKRGALLLALVLAACSGPSGKPDSSTGPDSGSGPGPAVIGHVFTTAYAEPGYVAIGNIIPASPTFRFAAGAGNANAPFIITWAR
jgi:hypothetical protein